MLLHGPTRGRFKLGQGITPLLFCPDTHGRKSVWKKKNIYYAFRTLLKASYIMKYIWFYIIYWWQIYINKTIEDCQIHFIELAYNII